MQPLEKFIIDVILQFTSMDGLNEFLGQPRNVAILVGMLVALSGSWLGTFLLLRNMSMTSDAISHTVLFGIVVAFLLMLEVFDMEPDVSSPWLIIGAAGAGVLTVLVTEAMNRSGLVREDAALGLTFSLFFALSIILISRYIDNVHIDEDAVLVGEIGLAWADTNSYCYENCDEVVITPDDPRAETRRECVNCGQGAEGIHPRHPDAVFEEFCDNCGPYTAAEAKAKRLIPPEAYPQLVFWPKSLTVMGLITLVNIAFVLLLYKELKLSTFDAALAATLGFRPGLLTYLLMVLVSVTAVGAFDAVGAVLVVAFFIIPPATAYILTDRLSAMLWLSPVFGGLSAFTGYELSRGNFLWIVKMDNVLTSLDRTIGLDNYTTWNTSISAAMVLMTFVFFLLAWVISPRYGLLAGLLRRLNDRRRFAEQLMLAHLAHHQGTPEAITENALVNLPDHLQWSSDQVQRVIGRLRLLQQIHIQDGQIELTDRGLHRVNRFRQHLQIK